MNPPPRPGAMLWSLAAGPLVNVALLPLLGGAYSGYGRARLGNGNHAATRICGSAGFSSSISGCWFSIFCPTIRSMGGQILWSLLWFGHAGRGRSFSTIATRSRVEWARWLRVRFLICDPFNLAHSYRRLHASQLLGWVESRSGTHPNGEEPAAGGLRVSGVRLQAAHWRQLGVRALPPEIRHLRNRSCLPASWRAVLVYPCA